MTGKKIPTQRYTCSFSDPYNIRKLIETKKFSALEKFKLNLEALQIKHTGKIDNLNRSGCYKNKINSL